MATTPFSDELVAKLKGATAWRFGSQLGPVFTPIFFCCTDPNELGLSEGKIPVAVLRLSPNPAGPGDTISFDGSDSYDPDGSITGYAWFFTGGTPASSSAATGTVTWAAAGSYQVTLIVTDGTGLKSSPARATMAVVEPQHSYFIATSNGVWYSADGGQTWTAKNTGLAGDALAVNDVTIDPASQGLADGQKRIWIATDDGLYFSSDGGGSWTKRNISSVANTWGDSPAPAVGDLRFVRLLFAGDRLFAIANWTNAGGDERGTLFYADRADDFGTWTEVDLFDG